MPFTKSFRQIPVGLLKVDPALDSQRQFQQGWARKLARIWNPDLLLPAIVSLRADGCYYLIDGQHSCHVARLRHGDSFLRDCVVYEGLTLQQEAQLFLAANRDRKSVRPYDTYRVELTAGDPTAVQVAEEVTACGLEIAGSPSTNRVAAVQKLKTIADKRRGLVTLTLQVAERAWGRTSLTWDNMMLQALAVVLDLNWNAVDETRLIRTLEARTVSSWKAGAIGVSVGGGGSTSRSTPLARDILDAYSRRLSPARMLTKP
ncbi:DUF6551 family protein [Actinoplanes sp. NPDC020271]|uniref:DUF6551 family protein n=1 Tax=Actinoplanes sp. NPDC020271 TaxID=3363896 RepID=UPI003796D137